jgi:L-glyceraldehyde 3-phosphate reductase
MMGDMRYTRCGRSGLMLPAVSLGLWYNYGEPDCPDTARAILRFAWEQGITHFDLANIYGPPKGDAERFFGNILRAEFKGLRDQMVISTKAGWPMWDGPYGDCGSRKHLIASLDQSLARMGLEYVDIFYHHRPDPETPLEETMAALGQIVRQGKALYVGISSYNTEQTRQAMRILRKQGTPCLIHQPLYNIFSRGPERELFPLLEKEGIGCIPFSPLAQGLLTDRYLQGKLPVNSRVVKPHGYLKKEALTTAKLAILHQLNDFAGHRGQSLAAMSLAWVLHQSAVTSVLIGASCVDQVEANLACLESPSFSSDELEEILAIVQNEGEDRG